MRIPTGRSSRACRRCASTPKTSNGVVTYQTVLTVDNAERLLQPGMTATAEITVTQVTDACWSRTRRCASRRPRRTQPRRVVASGSLPRPPGRNGAIVARGRAAACLDARQVSELKAIEVASGATDGKVTVVRGGELRAGDAGHRRSRRDEPSERHG